MDHVQIDGLAAAIEQELTSYSNDVIASVKQEAKSSMKRLVKDTKATAPVGRRKKHYRDSITSSKTEETARSVSYVWHVKGPDYRLSHLLENGHQLRTGGRVEGSHFIQKASEPILADYEKAVEEICKNGS